MKNIGMNDASSAAGAWTPTITTSEPMTAASEYAGAVDASPMTRASTNPIAFAFSPACSPSAGGRSATTAMPQAAA